MQFIFFCCATPAFLQNKDNAFSWYEATSYQKPWLDWTELMKTQDSWDKIWAYWISLSSIKRFILVAISYMINIKFTEMSFVYSILTILFICQNFAGISCEHECSNYEGKWNISEIIPSCRKCSIRPWLYIPVMENSSLLFSSCHLEVVILENCARYLENSPFFALLFSK